MTLRTRVFVCDLEYYFVLKTGYAVESGDCFHKVRYYENLKFCKIFETKNLFRISLNRKDEEINFATHSKTWKENPSTVFCSIHLKVHC